MPEMPRVILLLEMSSEYGRELLHGVAQYARLHGPWSLDVAPPHVDLSSLRRLARHKAGIIARVSSSHQTNLIKASRLPAVVLEPDALANLTARLGFSEVRSNSPAIADMAADHLLGVGFRHLAYYGQRGCRWSQARGEHFARRAAAARASCSIFVSPRPGRYADRLHHQLLAWLQALPKPAGIMACNDDFGRRLIQACVAAGLQVPVDVAVIGVDDDPVLCESSDPPLSSVSLDLRSAGYAASGLLHGLMDRTISGRKEILVNPLKVTLRRSTGLTAQTDRDIAQAILFIRNNAARDIGVKEVAEQVPMCRRTLERRMIRATGHTVAEEITRCRLARAKQLLSETSAGVRNVALSSGFGDLKRMTRAFRQLEHCSAADYRRRVS